MKKEFALFDLVEVPRHIMGSTLPIYGRVFRVIKDGAFVMYGQQPVIDNDDTNFVPLSNLLRVINPATGDYLFSSLNFKAVLDLAEIESAHSYRYFSNQELQELENVSTFNFRTLDSMVEALEIEIAEATYKELERKQMYNGLSYK